MNINQQIHHGNCLEELRRIPAENADMVITDPPYGINYQSCRPKEKTDRKAKISGDKQPFVWFLPESFRITKKGGGLLCFCRWDTLQAFSDAVRWAGYTIRSTIIWDRAHHGMGDLKGQFAPMHDMIIFAAKGKYQFPGRRPNDVIRVPRVPASRLLHPNEKPVELMEHLVVHTTKPGDIVVDPFAGCGSTLVATQNTGRRGIGIEIDAAYVAICKQRLGYKEATGNGETD